jgi:hypothetical protein
MGFNMCPDDTVRFDHGARLRINIVPPSAHLCVQPALQRSKQIRQTLAVPMRAFDALELWQKFIAQVGLPSLFAWPWIPTWSLDDHFMHVWSHDD